MQLKVLGCSGGVGGHLRTTTLLIDDDILIDAGTGVGELDLSCMAKIRHIFLTHSHMDHIASIPLMVDSIFEHIEPPLVIHGLQETINALKTHIFNNVIWPDFARLPCPDNPVMVYEVMKPGDVMDLGEGRSIEMIPVNHIVPGVGYCVDSPSGSFAFSGDTSSNNTFWDALNRRDSLDLLIVEAAFQNKDVELCRLSGHYCPELLGPDLAKLRHQPEVYISHNKPGAEEKIFAECQAAIQSHTIHPLSGGQQFTL